MDTAQPSLKKAAQVALGAMAVLFIMSILLFKERLFADTSYIVFNIVNYRSLAIQVQRYGSFITQMVPFIGQKLHLPIKVILMGYETSFSFFFLIIASILYFRFRQYALVILMALYYYLLVSDSYFFVNNELHQAMAWMFLMFGSLLYAGNRGTNTVLLIAQFLLFSFLALFTHFIVIIPTIFLWIYFIIERKNWPFSKQKTILLTSLLLLTIIIKAITGSTQTYEEAHLHRLTHFSLQDILDSFVSPVVGMFCYRLLTNYWIALLITIAGIATLFKNKAKPLAWWTIASLVGYIIIMGLTYGTLDKYVKLFHIETEWQSIGIIMATPFVFNFLPRLNMKNMVSAVAVVFIIRLAYIGLSTPAFIWRVQFHEQVMAQMKKKGITKLAIYHEQELNDKYILEWTAPYESILTSAMNGDKPQLTFFFVSKDEKNIIASVKDTKGIYLADLMQPSQINTEYYQPDTTRPYEIMTKDELFR